MDQPQKAALETSGAAFARINAVTSPTLDDLKTMVFLEASGQVSYDALAEAAPSPAIRKLLEANGREELAHAHRVAKVVKILSGEDFAVPPPENNHFAQRPAGARVDRPLLEMLVQAEANGATLYDTWAANVSHPEAAALLRQNAREEARHGDRAAEALGLLGD